MKKLILFLSLLSSSINFAQDGSLDTGFMAGLGFNSSVLSIKVQEDNKIIIAGNFTEYNGTAISRIARLNSDGTLDTSFNVGTGVNGTISTTAIQVDGKIIIGGWFTEYNGTPVNRIARLTKNGTLDSSFNPGIGPNLGVSSTSIQSDGKIIISGSFTTYNGTPSRSIARLNDNGTLDTEFSIGTGSNYYIFATAIQNNGKIIIGGDFTEYNGTMINRIARLNTNGTLDSDFNIGLGIQGGSGVAYSINIVSGEKIIIGGFFNAFNGSAVGNIIRLNTSGSLDTNFASNVGANNYISSTAVQSDGKIIIGGVFTTYNGTARNRIAKLNADGTLDSNFNVGTGVDNQTSAIGIQSDGKIIIGGHFTTYNGTTSNYIARLNNTLLSVNDSEFISTLKVFPNPTKDFFNINIEDNASFEIYNISGKLLDNKAISSGNSLIDISSYNTGIYIAKITNENNQSKTTKVVKK
jgi:uncharacterized delta-60 repeat protein